MTNFVYALHSFVFWNGTYFFTSPKNFKKILKHEMCLWYSYEKSKLAEDIVFLSNYIS